MTPICVPIFVTNAQKAIADVGAAVQAGAGLVELRCDESTPEVMERVLKAVNEPGANMGAQTPAVIITVRPAWEGGKFTGGEPERIHIFQTAAAAGAAFIDVELTAWETSSELRASVKKALATNHCRLIISNHDFSGRPADLLNRLERLRHVSEAAILKLVWKATGLEDAIEALGLTWLNRAHDTRPLLALAMGEEGQLSRILGAKFGHPFTFATLERGAESAPGQPTIQELKHLFRWDAQTPDSAVCGVVGWPVRHSMSPAIHNAGYAATGFDGIYVPLAVPEGDSAFAHAVDALRTCPGMNLRGLSITLPHKAAALKYVDDRAGTVEPLARHIGAINTIFFSGAPFGSNSDYAGALDALVSAMGISRDQLAEQKMAVLGAGGAARAIVAGLANYGAAVQIFNRTEERAAALAKAFNGKRGRVGALQLNKLCASKYSIYINCTPIGMHPQVDASPISEADMRRMGWNEKTVVFDTIYNPLETKFLRLAKSCGAKTVPGLEMFVGQAAAQFKLFTGFPAPLELFRKVVADHLRGA